MRVIISIGHGRLHLLSSAYWIARAGVSVRLLCGWAPKTPKGLLVRIASRLVGRDLSAGFRKRVLAQPNHEVCSCAYAEIVDQILRLFCRALGISTHRVSSLGWSLWGFQSRFFLKKADVFHCRSGAGQGGAIKKARRLGLKVLVDHSALHPAKSEQNLKDDYARWGQEIAIAPNKGVWKNVLKDCRDADVIMVNANHIRDSFVEFGFPFEKLRVVYLGVREDFQSLKRDYHADGTLKVLFTGAFTLLKGAEYMLQSLQILVARGVPVRYDIVGSVESPKTLLDKYKDLPIVYHGAVPQDELKSFLSDADLYLFPSLADGCAQSGMEALTAGLPVVATYQSGLPIVDGETGCVVPMKDAQAIADKIAWLRQNQEVREMLGRNAAEMMRENYTWEKYAENVKRLYEELAGTAGGLFRPVSDVLV